MGWLSGLFRRQPPIVVQHPIARESAPKPPRLEPWVVWRGGSWPMEVVGESHRQDALAAICGGHSRDGHDLECVARLVPDPKNPYDSKAVKVTIQGYHVGFLGRDQAERYGEALAAAGLSGRATWCAAIIKGGWRTNQHDEGDFGARLGIPTRGEIGFEDRPVG